MKVFPSLMTFLLLLISTSTWSQTKREQIATIVHEYITPASPGLAIMATEGGELIYEESFGLNNLSNKEALQTTQHFRIGSITKQFTAIAILKLVQENKLNLEDTIGLYLPEAGKKKSITIRHLLNHTSGLGSQSDIPSFENKATSGDYPHAIMEGIWNAPLKFTPGTQFYYSNLAYIVLGYIIEKASGISYEEYLKTNFFDPLGMKNTGFEYQEKSNIRVEAGYSKVDGKFEKAASLNMEVPYAAGGIVSMLADLSIWNRSVMQGKVIPPASLDQIMKSGILSNGNATGYSMGWRLGAIQGMKTIKHDGIINGFTSMAIYIPAKDVFVAVLSNCDCYRDIEIPASKIAATLIDQPFPSTAIALDKELVKSYQGTYQNGDDEIRVVLHDDRLMYYPKNGLKASLIPVAENKFLLPNGVDYLTFEVVANQMSYTQNSLAGQVTWQRTSTMDAYLSLALTNSDLDEFVGRYQVKDRFVFEVFREGDKMYGQIGDDRKEILCYDKDKFCVLSMDALLDFQRGDNGEITKLTVKQGATFTGLKIDE